MGTDERAPARRQLAPLLLAGVASVGLGVGAVIRGASHDHEVLGAVTLAVGLCSFVLVGVVFWRAVPHAPAAHGPRQLHERWLLGLHLTGWLSLGLSLAAYVRAADEGIVDWPVRCGIVALAVVAQTARLREDAKKGEQQKYARPLLLLPAGDTVTGDDESRDLTPLTA